MDRNYEDDQINRKIQGTEKRDSIGRPTPKSELRFAVTWSQVAEVEFSRSGYPFAFQDLFTIGNPIVNIYIFGFRMHEPGSTRTWFIFILNILSHTEGFQFKQSKLLFLLSNQNTMMNTIYYRFQFQEFKKKMLPLVEPSAPLEDRSTIWSPTHKPRRQPM